jgi:hypothetical protein
VVKHGDPMDPYPKETSTRRRFWILTAALGLVLAAAAAAAILWWWSAKAMPEGFEAKLRQESIRYLEQRFDANVKLERLDVHVPKLQSWRAIWNRRSDERAAVSGSGLVLSAKDRPDLPPLLQVQSFRFEAGLGILNEAERHIAAVYLDGVQIVIPPKPDRPAKSLTGTIPRVIIDTIAMHNSRLTILPKRLDRNPLEFTLQDINLRNAGRDQALQYDAYLSNPKPNGWIRTEGMFGPWNSADPSGTPLRGKYTFSNADLGVFDALSGILQSTGSFSGTLSELAVSGEARVPGFQLKRHGRPMPLSTSFEALVDGTNGDTHLRPVRARLGTSDFSTSGAIVKREKGKPRAIRLTVHVPKGNISDFLKLAMQGEPVLTGEMDLRFTIDIPPLDGKVKEKLILDGTFRSRQTQFLRAEVAAKVEELSQRGQGKPGQDASGETLADFRGRFHLEDQVIRFPELQFSVPGAGVDLEGQYDMALDALDFRGALRLQAKVSQTLSGWKRWAAKPLDPFFAKNGAGTFLRIQITGPAKSPSFGLAKKK